ISFLLKNQGVTLVKGHGKFIDSKTIHVSSNGRGKTFKANRVIVATGSRPISTVEMKIDGRWILSTDQALEIQRIPENILIIGGGVIGVEFATIFHSLGSRVRLIEMLPEIIPNEDEEVSTGLRRLMEKEGIDILTNTKVLHTLPKKEGVEVWVEKGGRKEKLLGEKVLLAIGRTPNTQDLHLDKMGIEMEGGFIKVNSKMETNVDGLYAIGDVIGKKMLAHAASAEGIVAVENIMGKSREIDYQKIPSCIYTFPEIASVGLKETEARERGYDIQIGRFPLSNSGKAWAVGETEGFIKLIAEKELGQIIGAHLLGEQATELIGEILLAINLEASIEDLGEVVKGHPTLSESITEAALDWQKKAIHQAPNPVVRRKERTTS
ncbi:MAG: dihydrolipoyl dehydrogenase, partial [Thermodesulfobacteriota bacterium]